MSEEDYRTALYACQRALMHAEKWLPLDSRAPQGVVDIVNTALVGANNVLDKGGAEANEQIAT